MSWPDDEQLPPLEVDFAQKLAFVICDTISQFIIASPGLLASVASKKLISRHIASVRLSEFDVLDKYDIVILDEITTIFDRILIYPYTAKYRKHLRKAPKKTSSAWVFHSQSLRIGEVYIIQDRTVAILELLKCVADNCGIPTTDCRKKFEKVFKKTFERHLRERHRLTHAHERPSLRSRVGELAGVKWTGDKDKIRNQLDKILDMSLSNLFRAAVADGRDPPKSLKDIEKMYEKAAEREARQMLQIVAEAFLATVNHPELKISWMK